MFSSWVKNGGICIPWQLTSSFFVWYVHRALSHAQVAENINWGQAFITFINGGMQ
jgi:hypothetical protein